MIKRVIIFSSFYITTAFIIIWLSTHWGRVTHTCVGHLTIVASDNGSSHGRRQAIFWTRAGILLSGPLRRNFSEFLIGIHIFSFKKLHLNMSSWKCRPFCLGLNVLTLYVQVLFIDGVPTLSSLSQQLGCQCHCADCRHVYVKVRSLFSWFVFTFRWP